LKFVLPIFVIVVFSAVIIRVQRNRIRTRALRHVIEGEKVTFRARVGVKVKLPMGDWSLKTLGGMELVVREDAFQVTLVHPKVGSFLGSEWYFRAADTTIETTRWRILGILPMDWIIIRNVAAEADADLAISSRHQLGAIWRALIDAGAQSLSLPPRL